VQKSQHIFLCGFMGSGKSTHGKKLARLLKLPFEDLDLYIQNKEHKTIQFIFENEGENEFRTLETKYLKELILSSESSVISLGGGTVCFNNNLEFIKENGILIFIEMLPEALAERLQKSNQKRPLLKNHTSASLLKFIEDTLEGRNAFYHKAQLIVDGNNLTHIQLHKLLLEYKTQNKLD
jgi:shikimate kinase